MDRHYVLCLVQARTDEELERVDAWLEPDTSDGRDALRRHYLAMAARAADERRRPRLEDMPWLHDYTLLVRDGAKPARIELRFREG